MYKVISMAASRKDALLALGSVETQVCIHILKVVLNPTHVSTRHWVTELQAWLIRAHNKTFVKGSKRLRGIDIQDHLFGMLSNYNSLVSVLSLLEDDLLPAWVKTQTDFHALAKEIYPQVKFLIARLEQLLLEETLTKGQLDYDVFTHTVKT